MPEFFKHHGSAVQIDMEDRFWRCLTGRDACGVNQANDVADARRLAYERMHGLTRRHVNGRDAYLVTGIAQDLGCRVRAGLAAVSKHDVLPDAHAAGDRLTNLSGTNQDDDVAHDSAFVVFVP